MHTIKQITDVSQLNGKIVANAIVMNGTNGDLNLPVAPSLETKTITENGTYVPSTGHNGFSQVVVNVQSAGGYGAITGWEGNKTFDSFEEAGELNWVNKFGALLWMHPDTGRLIANNADESQDWDPKDDTASTPEGPAGYSLLGVCVGLGKWAYYDPDHATETLALASSDSERFSTLITNAIHTDGWNATNAILDVEDTATNTIFARIAALQEPEGENFPIPVFLPSKLELAEMQNNCCSNAHSEESGCSYSDNIGTLLSLSADYGYWSSSQDPGDSRGAFYVYFGYGNVDGSGKDTTDCRAVLFLHFGEE